jgi:predicted nucleic acid-binding protein
MALFIDTNVFIDALHGKNTRGEHARELIKKALSNEYGAVYTSDYVLVEYVSAAVGQSRDRDRKTKQDALEKIREGEKLIQDSAITLLHVDEETIGQAKVCFNKYSDYGLTLTDWTCAVLMRKNRIDRVMTFDAGFERLKSTKEYDGIERMC